MRSCGAGLGLIIVLSILLPSFPGIEKPHRRTEQTNPCESRRFREQPSGKRGIDRSSTPLFFTSLSAFSRMGLIGWLYTHLFFTSFPAFSRIRLGSVVRLIAYFLITSLSAYPRTTRLPLTGSVPRYSRSRVRQAKTQQEPARHETDDFE